MSVHYCMYYSRFFCDVWHNVHVELPSWGRSIKNFYSRRCAPVSLHASSIFRFVLKLTGACGVCVSRWWIPPSAFFPCPRNDWLRSALPNAKFTKRLCYWLIRPAGLFIPFTKILIPNKLLLAIALPTSLLNTVIIVEKLFSPDFLDMWFPYEDTRTFCQNLWFSAEG